MSPDRHDLHQFISALYFSATKHQNQRRKNREQTPYINHPIEVAELWSFERRRDYLEWAGRVVDGCRGVSPRLERYFDETLARSSEALGIQRDA